MVAKQELLPSTGRWFIRLAEKKLSWPTKKNLVKRKARGRLGGRPKIPARSCMNPPKSGVTPHI